MSLSELSDPASEQQLFSPTPQWLDERTSWRYISVSGHNPDTYELPEVHISPDSTILWMNASMQALLAPEDRATPYLAHYLRPEDWVAVSDLIRRFQTSGEKSKLVTSLQTPAQPRVRWWIETAEDTPSPKIVLSCAPQAAHQEPVPRHHNRLHTTVHWSYEERVWKLDDQFEKLMGIYPHNIAGATQFLNRIAPADMPAVQACLWALLSDKTPDDCTFSYRHPDGQVYLIQLQALRHPTGFTITLSDITPRQLFSPEELLDKLRLALSISGLGIWEYNPVSRQASWDDHMFELYGQEPTYYVSPEIWLQCLAPEDAAYLAQRFADTAPGPVWTRDIRIRRPDGHERVIWCCGYTRRDDAGNIRLIGTHQDISVQHEALLMNKNLSDKLSIATRSARVGVWEADFGGSCYWDAQMYDIYGFTPRPASVNAYGFWLIAVHPDDYHTITRVTHDFIEGVIPYYDVQFRIVRPSGEIRYIRAYAGRTSQAGAGWRVAGVNWDITAQTLLQQEKDQYAERLKLATQGAQLGILDIDIKTGHILWDAQMYRLLGTDPDSGESPLTVWGKRIHPEDNVMVAEVISQLHRHDHPFSLQYRVLIPETGIRYLRAFGQMIRDSSGAPARLVGVTWDETSARVAEQERIIFSNRLMLATQGARIGVWEFEVKTGTIVWDDITHEVMGVPQGMFEGTPEAWQRLLHPGDVQATLSKVNQALEGKAPYDTEVRLISAQGIRYVHTCAHVIRDIHGQPERMVGIVWDITSLRSTEINHQALLDAVPDMMLRLSHTGEVLAFKPGFWTSIQHGDQSLDALIRVHLIGGVTEALYTRQRCVNTFQLTRFQDKPIHLEVRIVPAGEHEAVCIIRDITQDVAARESLLHKNKQLEAFAELASHVLRKPTANVAGLLEILDNAASLEQREAIVLLRNSFYEFDQALRSMALSLEELERTDKD